MQRKWTIAIRPAVNEIPRKITKIIGLRGAGYLCKVPMEFNIAGVPGSHPICWEDTIGYTVEDRVKLSYHSDGFAQFSSETTSRIISGRDPETGQPKGLGLITHPLGKPIWSGASIGIGIWGIDEFEEVQDNEEVLVFEPDQFYYRACTPAEANRWLIAVYVFPKRVIPPIRYRGGHIILDAAIEGLNGPISSVVQLSVLPLPKDQVFLGIIVNHISASNPSRSGWILSGPGDYTKDQKGHVPVI
jgi:hypothetical protein